MHVDLYRCSLCERKPQTTTTKTLTLCSASPAELFSQFNNETSSCVQETEFAVSRAAALGGALWPSIICGQCSPLEEKWFCGSRHRNPTRELYKPSICPPSQLSPSVAAYSSLLSVVQDVFCYASSRPFWPFPIH